jgi:hypothetical protein
MNSNCTSTQSRPLAVNGWQRVSLRNPCPVCGSTDWCLVQENGSAAICPRTPEGAYKDLGEAGFLHRLKNSSHSGAHRRAIAVRHSADGQAEMEAMAASSIFCLSESELVAFAESMGLSPESLRRLRVGWSHQHRAFTFPMHDAGGNVLGIRLRLVDGRKLSVRGGHSGLHIPAKLGQPQTLLFTEGPTDCAAMLDLGFAAVGRASCIGGVELATNLVRQLNPTLVVVCGDNDPPDDRGRGPGLDGAIALAKALAFTANRVKVLLPPAGIKDLRAWKIAGATAADVTAAIKAAPPVKVQIALRRTGGAL